MKMITIIKMKEVGISTSRGSAFQHVTLNH